MSKPASPGLIRAFIKSRRSRRLKRSTTESNNKSKQFAAVVAKIKGIKKEFVEYHGD